MTNHPLVSVIITAYNCEFFIDEAIESMLRQTYKNMEIIVVNDSSTDGTLKRIIEFAKTDERIKVISNKKNLGVVGSSNRGLENTRGEYIARLDGDDWSFPDRIEKQIDFMEKNPDVVVLGGSIAITDENLNINSSRQYPLTDREIRKRILRFNPFGHSTIVMRKDALIRVGSYAAWCPSAEDYELYFRLGLVGKFANLPDILIKYRIVPSSITHKDPKKTARITLMVSRKYWEKYHAKLSDKLFFIASKLAIMILPAKILLFLSRKMQGDKKGSSNLALN